MAVFLGIAPIDIVYDQLALLRLLAFLNAAWPPPDLDPIVVRTRVTLGEIVRERLVGPHRPHRVQQHQQSLQDLRVRDPQYCLITPPFSKEREGWQIDSLQDVKSSVAECDCPCLYVGDMMRSSAAQIKYHA